MKIKRASSSIFLAAYLGAVSWCAAADTVFFPSSTAVSPAEIQEQRLHAIFSKLNPSAGKEAAEAAARAFLEHIRGVSPIAAEKLAAGRMDDGELESRFGVFLKDRPELAAGTERKEGVVAPRVRVAELLKREEGIAGGELELLALADKFISRLAERSGTAGDSLRTGRMPNEELASRVAVFVADLKAEAAAANADPAEAALDALIDSYVQANFGREGERVDEVSYSGTIEEGGAKREFTIFRKRPGKLRMHFVKDGLVMSVLGYDGATAWRQAPGKPAQRIPDGEVAVLRTMARFDPPLVGYRARGAVVSREGSGKAGELVLRVRETDGEELFITIDEASLNEISSRSRTAAGRVEETRYRDHKKSGVLNVAYMQEQWTDGALRSTTRIERVRAEPGLLDAFFAPPQNESLGYMDYMGALIVIRERSKTPAAAGTSNPLEKP